MLKRLSSTFLMALLAACASTPEPEPEPAPPPVEITESAPPPPAQPPPPPDKPPRPEQGDGPYRISIAALDRPEIAPPWVSKAEAAGYRTELLAVDVGGKTYHRVLLPGYASLDDAKAALVFVQQELAPDAWITSRRRAPGPSDAPAEASAPPPDAPPPPPEQPAN